VASLEKPSGPFCRRRRSNGQGCLGLFRQLLARPFCRQPDYFVGQSEPPGIALAHLQFGADSIERLLHQLQRIEIKPTGL
jgi:hypothetical protein